MAWRRGFSVALKEAELCGGGVGVLDGFDDASRVDALMDVQTDGWHIKAGVFGFACPDQLRFEVWVVVVGFLFGCAVVGACVDQPHRRVVEPLFILMRILLNLERCGGVFFLASCHT